jgi:hypothetical protein
MRRLEMRVWTVLVLLHAASACSGDPAHHDVLEDQADAGTDTSEDPSQEEPGDKDAGTPVDDADAALPPAMDPFTDLPEPVRVDTVAPAEVVAGQDIMVSCQVVDSAGEVYDATDVEVVIKVAPVGSVLFDADRIVAQKAGSLEVSCALSSLRLVDTSPAVVNVVPGPAAFTVTTLDRASLTAGERVNASCQVRDAFENVVENAPATLRIDPSESGNVVDGLSAALTKSGVYDLACDVAGAASRSTPLEVLPAAPESIVITKVPDEPLYAVGEVVEIASVVSDRFGNAVPGAHVRLSSAPTGTLLGSARLRYFDEGTYRVVATVDEADAASAETTIVVDGVGPRIRCGDDAGTGPRDGSMWNAAPGASVPFAGSVADAHGVSEVRVNGQPVTVDASGAFTTSLTVRFGMNIVDIVARDTNGAENTRLCAFIAADRWLGENAFLNDDVVLALTQDAIDDGNRGDGMDSLDDILHTVVNSQGLRDSLHNALLSANPIKPSSCDQSVFGLCVLRSQIDYLESRLDGPNTTALSLIDGGFHVHLRLENVNVRLHVSGTFNSTGWVHMGSIDVDADMSVALSGGRPRVNVRDETVAVNVGSISTDFDGLSGFILDIVLSIAQGRVRSLVSDAVSSWVKNNMDAALDGVVSGLDIRTLGSTLNVPRLDGGPAIPVGFGLDFSSLFSRPDRLSFGIATRFSAAPAVSYASLGVPLSPGAIRDEAGGPGSAIVSVHSALFGQLLHTLWRGGLFEANLGAGALGGSLPASLSLAVSAALPPVAVLRNDGLAQIDFAALHLRLTYPGLFDEPIELWLSARSHTRVALVGNDLRFSELVVDELFFSTPDATLDGETRDTVEGVLLRLIQNLVAGALDNALPALPIPSFTLPEAVRAYGLTPGMELGLIAPVLAVEPQHYVLRSRFGAR